MLIQVAIVVAVLGSAAVGVADEGSGEHRPSRVSVASPAANATAPGQLALVSSLADGTKLNAAADGLARSSDGRYVAFSSRATNVDPEDTDGIEDVFVKDLTSGEVRLVNTTPSGERADDDSMEPSLSADGSRVAFISYATNLHPRDDPLGDRDVFVKDLVTGELILASAKASGERLGGYGYETVSISDDGTKVAFHAFIELGEPELSFIKDMTTGQVEVVASAAPGEATRSTFINRHGGRVFSGDGSTLVFSTAASLHPDDVDTRSDVYLKDLTTGSFELIPRPQIGGYASGAGGAVISADGRSVAFASTVFGPGILDRASDVYVYDLDTQELQLVSGVASEPRWGVHQFWPSLSADGRLVSFVSSSDALHPRDPDALDDVYVRDRDTGALLLVSGPTASTVTKGPSNRGILMDSGSAVLFSSASVGLVPNDPDALTDILLLDLRPLVAIDISPETTHNPVKSGSGTVAVALLGSVTFDVTSVDTGELCFGSAGTPRDRNCDPDSRIRVYDANRDGHADLELRFEVAGSGIHQGDTSACLHGSTIAADTFEACDTIRAGRG